MKPNSGTLVINIMNGGKAEAYEGVYQCTARNERGAAISNNIIIRPSSKWNSVVNHEAFILICFAVSSSLESFSFFICNQTFWLQKTK